MLFAEKEKQTSNPFKPNISPLPSDIKTNQYHMNGTAVQGILKSATWLPPWSCTCLVVGFNREAKCFQMQEFYLGIRAPDSLASILMCSESSLYFHFLSIGGTDRREAVGAPDMPKPAWMSPGHPELGGEREGGGGGGGSRV